LTIYIFFDSEANVVWSFPWTGKDPPIIVEANTVRRKKDDDEDDSGDDEDYVH
jgi:hypothetical protein